MGYSEDFLEWYFHYPLKKCKHDAFVEWGNLKYSKDLPEVSELIKSITDQIQARNIKVQKDEWVPEWPHPAQWLRRYQWEDEVEVPTATVTLTAEEKWMQRIGK